MSKAEHLRLEMEGERKNKGVMHVENITLPPLKTATLVCPHCGYRVILAATGPQKCLACDGWYRQLGGESG